MRRGMLCFAALIAVLLVATRLSLGVEVRAINVRGKTIQVGDLADSVFGILVKSDMVSQDVRPDPTTPNSLLVTKNYKVDGKSFTIAFAKQVDPGPYVVLAITVDRAISGSGSSKVSIAAFEASSFLKKHKPSERDQWDLKQGGKNYSYSFPDPENPYSSLSVELSSDATNLKEFGVQWYGESTLEPAAFTSSKESFLREFLAAILPDLKPDSVISYVRSQKGKRYPGGGSTVPRKPIGGVMVHSGICGSSLFVGFEK